MQITDMLNQYNRNLANGIEISGGTQGIKQLISFLQEMSVGNIFEGSVNSLEDGVVTLGLPDGRTIQAKLDSGVLVHVGESMFFQVKSNHGNQIAIRPYSNGIGTNPTLLNALEAANLQVNGKMLSMVNAMMEQSMSIDKQSLMNMAKLVMGNEEIDVITIVQMDKLGIPITEEMAVQFENYKSDQYAILDQLESVVKMLPEQLSGGYLDTEQLLGLNHQMLKVLLGEEPLTSEKQNMVTDFCSIEIPQGQSEKTVIPNIEIDLDVPLTQIQQESVPQEKSDKVIMLNAEAETSSPRTTMEVITEEKGIKPLLEKLQNIPELSRDSGLISEGQWKEGLEEKDVLQFIERAFSSKHPAARQILSDLVSTKEYRGLIRNVMEQQWLLKPEELTTEHKIRELYERLDRHMGQIEDVLKSFHTNAEQLSDTTANVRNNIQFMQQLNQTYAYVQIPLKLAGQNAHSDLYIYSDKRKIQEKDGELTAFLHLDLKHLGSTDVSIRLHQKNITTNFYLEDDLSYRLISEHMDILEKKLEEKGYQVRIQIVNQEQKVNFVEDLLKQGVPSAGGMVHRYSFDVRA